jgi:general secretion pathway protein E
MVGEIRDTETADNALQAALTGHLVFSTLHTNDATSAITRLVDLKVKPFLITAGLVCVLAQRLVRVICETCATEFTATREKLHSYGINIKEERVTLREGAGCEECRFTGYYGRTGVYELLEIDDTLREMILKDASPVELRQYAISTGMTTLRDSAIKKVLTGVTTLEEGLKIGHYF